MAQTAALVDSFNEPALNAALWYTDVAGSATLTYAAGGITCNFPASSTSSTVGNIQSLASHDLTGSYAYAQVLSVPSGSTSADADLRLYQSANASFYVRWVYEAGTLFAQWKAGAGATTVTSFAYSAGTHRWWRIRESGGTTFWDTSADGITWTNQGSVANPITVTSLIVLIGGSCFQNETSPGTMSWNDFNTLGGGPPPGSGPLPASVAVIASNAGWRGAARSR